MAFDDAWVDEVSRGFKACKVFLWCPLYCKLPLTYLNTVNRLGLAYNELINNLTSQAAKMHLACVPNDIINSFNPLALIIFIPIMDKLFYPLLRKIGIQFTPLKRITTGFLVASTSMIAACVLQVYIYRAKSMRTGRKCLV